MNIDADRAAVAAFPELARLIDLREAERQPWLWRADVTDGEVVQINGFRVWPTYEVDAIRVRSSTDANGLRTLSDELGIVWERSGTLVDVVDGLFTLPAPGTPGAPRRVKGSSSGLWTP